jgi:hypothetical protein
VVLAGSWLIGSSAQHAPPPDATRSLDVRLVRAEQQIRELTDRPASGSSDRAAIDALTGRIAKLEAALTAARPAANDPALANRISALEGEVKAQAEIVAILGRRHDEVATASREARQRADVNAASNAELHEKIARLGTSPIERREFDALTTRIAAIERSEKALETELAKRPPDGTNDNAVRLAVISAALWGAVERGDTYASLLTMTKALAGDPKRLAPLEPFAATGLPSAAALGRQLSGLAPALYQAAGAAPREGILDRLAASAEKLVRVRPIEDVAGTDAVAIVSRVEARAAQADLSGALAELAKLPANVREPANAWIKTAEQRSAAIEASQRMATESLAALGARDTK